MPTQESDQGKKQKYELSVTEEGVYLTVYPRQEEEEPITEGIVVAELSKRQIREINLPLIVRTIKEAGGTSVRLLELTQERPEPEIQILVSRDRMQATLEITAPKGCRPVTMTELQEKIRSLGIFYGIDEKSVQLALSRPGLKVTFARGTPAVDGTPAQIKYAVDFSNQGKPAAMGEDSAGRVDLKNLQLFTMVSENAILAEKIPAMPGIPGTDIFGNDVPAKPGRDVFLPIGKNVVAVDNLALAGLSGHVQVTQGRLSVVPVIEIKGDVDYGTGNIEFSGNVVIRGSVQTDFSVKADGDVDIYGTVSGGNVTGRNVLVRMGIQGMHRGCVRAKDTVTAQFIENGNVYAGNEVVVSGVILHSQVSAGRRVIVEGRKGLIAGGHVAAGEEIRAKTAGTPVQVKTDLLVGTNPVLREEYQNLRSEQKTAEHNLDQARKAVNMMQRLPAAAMTAERKNMFEKLNQTQMQLSARLEVINKRIRELEADLKDLSTARIHVIDTVYPGVKVVIGNLIKPVREPLKLVAFYADDGEVKIGNYKA